jgi:hypothetical protein
MYTDKIAAAVYGLEKLKLDWAQDLLFSEKQIKNL